MTRPIFHLSFPVEDLERSIDFYQQMLGAVLGRREEAWADLALFGAQVTLQHAPADVAPSVQRTRHFGATLGWAEWQELTNSLGHFVEEPCIKYAGTDQEEAKAMIADPSRNLIELKAYRRPDAVLGDLAK
jgi:uncharacterized protein